MTLQAVKPYKHTLKWSLPSGPVSAPPEGVDRVFIPTPEGVLDIHFAQPNSPTSRPPLLFIHGGFGSALCYRYYLPFFAANGYPAYSVSLRGHGDSFNPGYWKMYFAPRQKFAIDACWAIKYVKVNHGGASPVVVGHSAGGGLIQYILSSKQEDVRDVVLLAPIPGYGSSPVNFNWAKMDIWMTLRMIFLHFFHPRSPLSSTYLVHQAFFSTEMPTERVVEVEKTMAEFESMSWPLSMLSQFVDPKKVAAALRIGAASGPQKPGRMLIIAGEKDRLMTLPLMQRLVDWYKVAATRLQSAAVAKLKKSDGSAVRTADMDAAVSMQVAPGVGHHMMLDVRWKGSAELVLHWLQEKYH